MQLKLKVLLNGVDIVKAFVNTVTKFTEDFDLVSGRYVIDGKSIMGIFSLDLSKPVELVVHTEETDNDTIEKIKEALKEFCYD